MSAMTEISRNTQRIVCMLVAIVMVAGSVSLGAAVAESAAQQGYSVTVEQL